MWILVLAGLSMAVLLMLKAQQQTGVSLITQDSMLEKLQSCRWVS